ncbi:hypothetical protein MKW92_031544 [Papaver armeniacum]|nr:hypothetical protein MKW92_031544 [Papaver armeniacum]
MMKVEVVSKESIKPSCPTPHHLKFFNLSFLDQLAPPIYANAVLYYCQNENAKKIIDTDVHRSVLKKSLAETLIKFYPLAGKIIDDKFMVDCNDEGADYIETKVSNCQLSQLIQHPNVHQLVKKFIPSDPYTTETSPKKVPLLVQVNFFEDCGGIVIGLRISHKLADAASLTSFINDWATVARGIATGDHNQQIKGPSFEWQSLFPPRDLMDEVLVTKKFVFGASKLAELKAKSIIVKESDDVPDQYQPTRVEVLSAFLWKCFIDIYQSKNKGGAQLKVYLAVHIVNMRSRMVPSLPTNSFGNVLGVSAASIIMNNEEGTMKNDQYNYPDLVGKIRESIKKVDADYVREIRTTDAQLDAFKLLSQNCASGLALMLNFSSWCRFPIYEADFGWGKPTWVSTGELAIKNMVMLMDSSSGDGIEAWIHLGTEDMAEFERHEELLELILN